MTLAEAKTEAQKLTDPGYFWGTVIANVPDQVVKGLFKIGIYTRDTDHVVTTIQNLITRQDRDKLKQLIAHIQFDFDKAPGYELAIQEFYKLIKPPTNDH